MTMAADRNNIEMVRILLDRGADVKSAAKVTSALPYLNIDAVECT